MDDGPAPDVVQWLAADPLIRDEWMDTQLKRHAVPGVRLLMMAIFGRAIDDLQLRGLADSRSQGFARRRARIQADAREWFDSDDEAWPFSFLNLCRLLGVDPSAARTQLLNSKGGAGNGPKNSRRDPRNPV